MARRAVRALVAASRLRTPDARASGDALLLTAWGPGHPTPSVTRRRRARPTDGRAECCERVAPPSPAPRGGPATLRPSRGLCHCACSVRVVVLCLDDACEFGDERIDLLGGVVEVRRYPDPHRRPVVDDEVARVQRARDEAASGTSMATVPPRRAGSRGATVANPCAIDRASRCAVSAMRPFADSRRCPPS